jgi:hypothetical protein
LEDERLDLLPAHAQHDRDVAVRVVAEFKEHQRGALVSRQPLHIVQHLAEFLAPLDLVRQAL